VEVRVGWEVWVGGGLDSEEVCIISTVIDRIEPRDRELLRVFYREVDVVVRKWTACKEMPVEFRRAERIQRIGVASGMAVSQ
jgi:hypothetical protein